VKLNGFGIQEARLTLRVFGPPHNALFRFAG